jgi:hypothetical protein
MIRRQSSVGRWTTQRRHVRELLARKLMQMEARRPELDVFCDRLRDYLRMCDQTLQSQLPGRQNPENGERVIETSTAAVR